MFQVIQTTPPLRETRPRYLFVFGTYDHVSIDVLVQLEDIEGRVTDVCIVPDQSIRLIFEGDENQLEPWTRRSWNRRCYLQKLKSIELMCEQVPENIVCYMFTEGFSSCIYFKVDVGSGFVTVKPAKQP